MSGRGPHVDADVCAKDRKGRPKSVLVVITDKCPECQDYHLDVQSLSFAKVYSLQLMKSPLLCLSLSIGTVSFLCTQSALQLCLCSCLGFLASSCCDAMK